MPIVAAVVHLSGRPVDALHALAGLARLPGLVIGERHGDRLPIVLDTPTREADREAWDAVSATPGVVHVDLVCADFSDLVPPADPAPEVQP